MNTKCDWCGAPTVGGNRGCDSCLSKAADILNRAQAEANRAQKLYPELGVEEALRRMRSDEA